MERITGLERLHERIDLLEQRMNAQENAQARHEELTKKISADTSELIAILTSVKGGIAMLATLGSVVKWTAGIAAAAYAITEIYTHYKNGTFPTLKG